MRAPNIHIRQFALVIGLSCFAAFCRTGCQADDEVVVRRAAEHATKVTVRLKAAGQFSSGVVIGRTGEILTVNHGLPSGVSLVTVTDFENRVYEATVVTRNESLDLAMLKIGGVDVPSYVAAIATEVAVANQSVIAAGYPARVSTVATGLIRIGAINRISMHLIRSTCQLTVGDSGGGVFDLDGRLIGINQRIGAGRSANIHATIQRCFEAIPAAKSVTILNSKAVVSKQLHSYDNAKLNTKPAVFHAWQVRTLQVLGPLQKQSSSGDPELLCHATLWSPKTAITKLSELRQHSKVQIRTIDRQTMTATVLKEDRSNDLAVLSLQNAISMRDVPEASACRLYQLVALGKGPTDVAILGRVNSSTSTAKSVLGCGLKIVEQGVQIERVSANSAAAIAQLLEGDIVVKVNDAPVRGFEDLAGQLQVLQPGDWAAFEILRNGQTEICRVQMQHDAATKLDLANFLDGSIRPLSLRRTGFANAIQHDGDLRPSEMGSPVLCFKGGLLGVNIAVRSRETTIAIPSKTIQALVDELSVE